ncbi:putative coniferyl aldehyde dehydrogenase [Desulfosarcina alkanivorans]|uniref:Aldehyde dehydrogenase n=1 Tax=Desulfosarcina alkanivorans TaxID=571177 RepID=A0A5K7YS91_9BACT|nr:coniferyl aldehyde dehydrogenase [Desulfosarcina alkanivorans]BBO71033.1 putative coniferyl aldehyde dehydrogenase [Desulfosarcina alkanivorans]
MGEMIVLKTLEPKPEAEIDRIFKRQQAAFRRHPMPDAKARIHGLKRLEKALIRFKADIAAAIDRDFGCRSSDESYLAEILPTLEGIRYAVKRIRRWMKPSRRRPGLLYLPARARVIFQPLGVVGIIAPWNYPVYLALGPLVGVLAAGNRAMIKMSTFTPRTAEVLKALIGEAFDEDQVAVMGGEPGLGPVFSRLPWDHLVFTGSTAVGRHVMRAAADNLTPVTLELGGKSPAIIGPAVSVADAAGRIAFGKVFNMGQTCVAPDYVLCPRGARDAFVARFIAAMGRMYPSMAENPQYTGIVNDREYERLEGLLADAVEKGARVVEVNPGGDDFSGLRKMPVRLLLEVNDDMAVMQEEIFGPLLPVIAYDTLQDAVAYVNSHPRPLALYLFDHERRNAEYVLACTHSGGALINDTLVHVTQDDMPFGGIGPSGMGQYHGHEGFLTFSKAKGVLCKSRFNSGRFFYPPYGGLVHRLIYRFFMS